MLKRLWDSTMNFHERFNNTDRSWDDEKKMLSEELVEFIEACKGYEDANYYNDPLEMSEYAADAVEELVDFIVVAMARLVSMGVEFDVLKDGFEYVASKNDAKTHETHHWQDGKIRRIK